jgi:hypothetical protein
MLSESSIVTPEFCPVFPPVPSNLITALSVDEPGPEKSPKLPPPMKPADAADAETAVSKLTPSFKMCPKEPVDAKELLISPLAVICDDRIIGIIRLPLI